MNKLETLVTRRAFLYTLLTMPPAMVLAACSAQPTPVPPTTAPQPTLPPPTAVPPSIVAPTDVPPSPTAEPPTAAPEPTQASSPTTVAQLEPTPACGDDDDEPTPAQTEGPYFTPNSPERASLLEPGMTGTKLTVTGLVLRTDCTPIARALIDVWQCDDAGVYDNVGYRLRGHLFTDEQGQYQFETILPGNYPGRTRHIHVKVQAPNSRVLTTQLYFPNEPRNQNDGIYRKECEMAIQDNADGSKNGAFNFVLNV
jgi:protocatechuate 3,4-dioxygenase beta subunit